MAELFREDHRLYQARWFQLFPAIAYAMLATELLLGARQPFDTSPWMTLLMPVLFFTVFASTGYRISVTAKGMELHGLGLFALHEALFGFIWRWADVAREQVAAIARKESWGIFRWFGFPAGTYLGQRGRVILFLGTPSFVEVAKKGGKRVLVGTRRPDELLKALSPPQ